MSSRQTACHDQPRLRQTANRHGDRLVVLGIDVGRGGPQQGAEDACHPLVGAVHEIAVAGGGGELRQANAGEVVLVDSDEAIWPEPGQRVLQAGLGGRVLDGRDGARERHGDGQANRQRDRHRPAPDQPHKCQPPNAEGPVAAHA
jgi:hypothetical protein